MRWMMTFALALLAMGLAASAQAKGAPKYPPGGKKCVDSFGAVIDGVYAARDCQKLGARWARPGSKVAQQDKPARKKHRTAAASGE